MRRLDFKAPTGWADLTQEQLSFLLHTITMVNAANSATPFLNADDYSAHTVAQVAAYCLLSWNGATVVTPYGHGWLVAHEGEEFFLTSAQIAAAAASLAWVGELPEVPVRLETINGAFAVAADLDDGFSFDDWLTCEALWQGYQALKDDGLLRQMAETLYHKQSIVLHPHEQLSIFYWWAAVKNLFARMYPDFFRPTSGAPETEITEDSLRRGMNAQIRALTKGDITKEETILAMPAHRALTELDAMAREYEELNRKYPTK